MELVRIACTTLGSIAVLFVLTKLIGNRQLSQMSMFDYVNGITIGSIAAEMATSLEDDFLKPLLAMVIYALASIAISYFSMKSMKARKLFTGTPIILYQNNKLYKKNLSKAKLDINEFLTQCRTAGYFDLSQLQTAVLETNGAISFLPKAQDRPVTPGDLGLEPPEESPCVNLIVDGELLEDNLRFTGNDEKWLHTQLHAQDVSKVKDVLLATCDGQNTLSVFAVTDEAPSGEIFE